MNTIGELVRKDHVLFEFLFTAPKALPDAAGESNQDWKKYQKKMYGVLQSLLEEAIEKKSIIEVADALTDILYVTYGTGHAFGVDLDACFEEVQKSNMSKLDKSKKPMYDENGKIKKGPFFFKPNLKKILKLK